MIGTLPACRLGVQTAGQIRGRRAARRRSARVRASASSDDGRIPYHGTDSPATTSRSSSWSTCCNATRAKCRRRPAPWRHPAQRSPGRRKWPRHLLLSRMPDRQGHRDGTTSRSLECISQSHHDGHARAAVREDFVDPASRAIQQAVQGVPEAGIPVRASTSISADRAASRPGLERTPWERPA